MSKELVVIDEKDPKVIELVKLQIARGASDIELRYFVSVCNRMWLDPFARQIWAIKRWDSSVGNFVLGIQVGIDGLRFTANRTGLYQGQLGPWWCGPDGVWKDVWLDSVPPFAAKVGIIRSDFREPVYAIAKYDAMVQITKEKKPNAFWSKMPDHMLAKCAEAQAIRKAFPGECVGVFSDDESEMSPEPELATPGKKAEKRMEKIQEEMARDVTPKEQAPSVEKTEPEKTEEPTASQEPVVPKKTRNFASGEIDIPAVCQMLFKFGKIKNIPETNARAYITKVREWSVGKTINPDVESLIVSIESYWGI